MFFINTFKVAALALVYAGSVSAASSSADPSTYNNETFYNSTTSIIAEPTSTPIALPSLISECTSCSFPPRSSRTAPGPISIAPAELSTTQTIHTTVTYTITSCGAAVTNCPIGHITTESIPLYVTVCPIGTPLPSLPIGPPGTEHPVYSSFVIPPGASPVPTIEPPHATATNAGAAMPPVDTAIEANAGVAVAPEPSSAAIIETSTKAAEGIAASTGLPPSPTGCAGSQCTPWISEASVRSISVLGMLAVVAGGFVLFL